MKRRLPLDENSVKKIHIRQNWQENFVNFTSHKVTVVTLAYLLKIRVDCLQMNIFFGDKTIKKYG